jgi:hypothetical protein
MASVRPPSNESVSPLAKILHDWHRGLGELIPKARSRKERERLLYAQRLLQPIVTNLLWPEPPVSARGHQEDAQHSSGLQASGELIDSAEVARRTGLNRRTVTRKAEKLGGRKVGPLWLFDEKTIDELVAHEENRQQQNEDTEPAATRREDA